MRGIRNSLRQATATPKRKLSVLIVGTATWIFFTLLTRPIYSLQLLSRDPAYIGEALRTLVWNQSASYGLAGVLLPPFIGLLVGLVAVTTFVSLLGNYHAGQSVTGALGSTVGFVGAGCAGCGAGVLSLMGVSGGVALLPFEGLGVQAAAALILIGSLEYQGRNEFCSV